ncbi:MAG: hypothetical protein QM796_20825 [Chthoniobacteraceae bacterium]
MKNGTNDLMEARGSKPRLKPTAKAKPAEKPCVVDLAKSTVRSLNAALHELKYPSPLCGK